MRININIQRQHLIILVIIFIVAIVGVVYAVAPSPGHTASEIDLSIINQNGPIEIRKAQGTSDVVLKIYDLAKSWGTVNIGSGWMTLSPGGSGGSLRLAYDGITFPDGQKQTLAADFFGFCVERLDPYTGGGSCAQHIYDNPAIEPAYCSGTMCLCRSGYKKVPLGTESHQYPSYSDKYYTCFKE